MVEAKGRFLRPFNKLACFPWDHYKQWSEEYLIILGKRRMTKLLGFIHRLERTVKYHTSETRHSLRNKFTDSNSRNGRNLGFIHRLKRTVKYHTSETRHSLRNKLTDSNSSNGRTIINSTEMFCSIALFTRPFWRI